MSETVWIFNFRGIIIEVAVGADDIITRADAPMEWSVGERWETVRSLFDVLGNVARRDPPTG